MKKLFSKLAALALSLAFLPVLPVSAYDYRYSTDDGKEVSRYVVLQKDGDYVIMLQADSVQYVTKWIDQFDNVRLIKTQEYDHLIPDTMMQEFIKTVKFGDIIEYTTVLDGHGIGDMGVFARTPLDDDGNPRPRVYDPNDTFEVVGSVFETPLASIYAKEIDGEQMIAVRIVDGSEYVIADHPGKNQYENAIYFEQPATEPSAAKPLPNALGDADSSGSVDLLDVIALNKNILGVMPLSDSAKAALDLNHDGVIDSSDSLLLLRYMVGLEEIG